MPAIRCPMRVKLLQDYVRDNEWWIAYPCDPRWSYFHAGDELNALDEEGRELIEDGSAVELPAAD